MAITVCVHKLGDHYCMIVNTTEVEVAAAISSPTSTGGGGTATVPGSGQSTTSSHQGNLT